MIVRGLHLGICRDEEKKAKKDMILGYLTSHLKVIFSEISNCEHNIFFYDYVKTKHKLRTFFANGTCSALL